MVAKMPNASGAKPRRLLNSDPAGARPRREPEMTNLATPSYPVNLAPLRKIAATIPRGSRNDYQMWKLAFAQTQDVRFRDLNRMVWGAPDGSGQVDSGKLLRDAMAADAAARA